MARPSVNLVIALGLLPAIALAALDACGGGGGQPAQAPPAAGASPPAETAGATAMGAAMPVAPVGPSAAASSPPAAASSSPAPLASILTTDASTIQRLFDETGHAPAATLKPKGALEDDPLAKGLRDLAKRTAPGMQPDGPLATATLKEKQSVQTNVTLEPGKCYAIVGYSKKVKDLDLYLLLSPGILSGQDTTDDNMPTIGGPPQPMCPVATTAVTYKLDVVADQGAGEVAVQLYARVAK